MRSAVKQDFFRRIWTCLSWYPVSACLMLMTAVCFFPFNAQSETLQPPFRIGFSRSTFGDINENDAIASVRVWAQAMARDRGIVADPQPRIFENIRDIRESLKEKGIDCITMCTNEYAALREYLATDCMVAGVVSGSIYEEFALVVHRKGRIRSLGDLKDSKIGLHLSWRTALAPLWLDTLLAHGGLGLATDFFGQIAQTNKITKAVLPVFFRQMDACLVTRSGFETMVELNPQVGQQLKILRVSPPFVPVAYFFRADYSSPLRSRIMGEITRWHFETAGHQLLNIFQVDRLEEHPLTCLKSALELLAAHEQLSGRDKMVVPGEAKGRGR
jgi:ABC-type phosphate/phosphonate transport system substrate-binding protein